MPLKDTIVNDTRIRGVSSVRVGKAQVKGQNTWDRAWVPRKVPNGQADRCEAQIRSNTRQGRRKKQTRRSG